MGSQNTFTRRIVLVVIILGLNFLFQKSTKIWNFNIPVFDNLAKQKYVFFDLGVNNGDSLLNFLEIKSTGRQSNIIIIFKLVS